MSGTPQVVEYGARVAKPKNLQEFKEQVREVHTTSVEMGAPGPLILLGAFLSSTAVLMYRGARYGVLWVQQRARSRPAL
jgi:hypothetical protein